MSRASEITLAIIMLQAAIGFVDATELFTEHYLGVPQNNATYTLTDLETYSEQTENEDSLISVIDLYANWAWEAFTIGIKIIFAVLFVLPTLITKFHVEHILATFIQVGIYYVYSTWYSQYKSGRGWKYYE